MKNLNNCYKMLPIILLFVLVSCKKNAVKPTGDDPVGKEPIEVKGIGMNELVDYYLVTERKTGNTKLTLMTFTNEGNVTKASVHGVGFLRIKEVAATNSVFSFDTEGFGTYSYTLEKDANGTIKLKEYSFNGGTDIAYALLVKKTDAFAIENSSFKAGELLFKINNTNVEWDIQKRIVGTKTGPPPLHLVTPIYLTGPAEKLPYYALVNFGFKTNNSQMIGLTVPAWLGTNNPVMLVEKAGASVLKAVKQ
ncbi:hypothetical protein ABIB40_001837 [Pedobacter sp. UYP30]|uniref:hypothetical protein n=1 Tax=Pedobacter sp. UYP30 TaxID=1756400 RepID=UPI00339B5F66